MSGNSVLILSRAEIARLMDYDDYVDALEATYRAAAAGRVAAPPALGLPVTAGSFHAKGAAVLGDESKVAIKINGNFPNNAATHGLPTIQGIIYLAEGSNGRPLAVMDSIEVTINRTAAATTLAARYLARPDSKTVTICGVGVQGRIQLKAIAAAVKLERIFVWDIDQDRAAAFAREMGAALSLEVQPSIDLACARQSDVIVTCTSARRAFLTSDLVRPGTFIAAVGADNADKSEIDPKLYAKCLVVVDSPEQATAIGDLHHAIAAGTVSPSHVHASLGELIAGAKQGRTDADAITLFDSTGMGLQDLSAAVAVYQRAIAAGVGTRASLA
jgi:alanine dehydrogenase